MPIFAVIRKSDQVEVYRYSADAPIEWVGFEFASHDHIEVFEAPTTPPEDPPEEWLIHVGPFYDRFGTFKLPILASTDPYVQAVIKDTTVRKYIDLKGRRAELLQAIGLLQSKGFAVSTESVLDVKPTTQEVYRG